MRIRLAGYVNDSIVDGEGMRLAVFTQGCPHHCPGCHNPKTHDPNGGYNADTDEMLAKARANPLLDGITLTGGEPFMRPEACAQLAKGAHELGLSVWCYTGYTFEALAHVPGAHELLKHVDVLVDGPFKENERTLDLPWRGSKNQRIIRLKGGRKVD